jgi:hypothetical protein
VPGLSLAGDNIARDGVIPVSVSPASDCSRTEQNTSSSTEVTSRCACTVSHLALGAVLVLSPFDCSLFSDEIQRCAVVCDVFVFVGTRGVLSSVGRDSHEPSKLTDFVD